MHGPHAAWELLPPYTSIFLKFILLESLKSIKMKDCMRKLVIRSVY